MLDENGEPINIYVPRPDRVVLPEVLVSGQGSSARTNRCTPGWLCGGIHAEADPETGRPEIRRWLKWF